MQEQQGDVLLFQTDNDGDVTVEGGITTMSSGIETAAYISLFGGNEDDSGLDGDPHNWWGNLDETETAKQYRSETQFLLQGLPATAFNLLKIEAAVGRDLDWFIEVGAATGITVTVSIPALNRVKIVIDGLGDDSLEFLENWQAAT